MADLLTGKEICLQLLDFLHDCQSNSKTLQVFYAMDMVAASVETIKDLLTV